MSMSAMFRQGGIVPHVWLVLSVLALAVRLGGLHVHLCLDGFEARQSLHWGEADFDDELRHGTASHRDQDICVQIYTVTQSLQGGCGLMAAPALLSLLIALLRPAPIRLPDAAALRPAPIVRYLCGLLPPAQAPPV
jgi:hypothetical protein